MCQAVRFGLRFRPIHGTPSAPTARARPIAVRHHVGRRRLPSASAGAGASAGRDATSVLSKVCTVIRSGAGALAGRGATSVVSMVWTVMCLGAWAGGSWGRSTGTDDANRFAIGQGLHV